MRPRPGVVFNNSLELPLFSCSRRFHRPEVGAMDFMLCPLPLNLAHLIHKSYMNYDFAAEYSSSAGSQGPRVEISSV